MDISDEDADSDTHSVASEALDDGTEPGAMEVFCGIAHYTLELQKAGFKAVGIDHKGCKNKPKAKALWMDLSTRAGQLEFWDVVRSQNVKYVHFAPPCGTASAARKSGQGSEPQTAVSVWGKSSGETR